MVKENGRNHQTLHQGRYNLLYTSWWNLLNIIKFLNTSKPLSHFLTVWGILSHYKIILE